MMSEGGFAPKSGWGGLLVAAVSFLLLGCQKAAPSSVSADTSESDVIAVETAVVQERVLTRGITVMGTLNPFEEMPLAAKVDGRVRHIHYDVGDRVLPGAVLFELEDVDYRLALAQARAAFEGELQRLKLTHLPQSVAEFERHLGALDAVAQARANWELAEKELARVELEAERGVGSPQSLDAARARVKAARAAVDLAETEGRVLWANARRLQAVLEEAQQRWEETRVRAPTPPLWSAWSALVGPAANPIRLAVAQRSVGLGEMVRAMPVTVAYRLVLDQILKLQVPVPEKYRPQVNLEDQVELQVEAWPHRRFQGRVRRIVPVVDPSTRTFAVEIAVPNFEGALSAGGFAQARILSPVPDTILTVPPEAIVSFAGVHKVFVVRDGLARSVPVELGIREKDWVEVRGKLQTQDEVVVRGQVRLVDGTPVRRNK